MTFEIIENYLSQETEDGKEEINGAVAIESSQIDNIKLNKSGIVSMNQDPVGDNRRLNEKF